MVAIILRRCFQSFSHHPETQNEHHATGCIVNCLHTSTVGLHGFFHDMKSQACLPRRAIDKAFFKDALFDVAGNTDAVIGNNDLKPGPSFKWLHESFGTNWRMTGMQATIGRVQLRKLPGWIERRRQNADILTKAFLNVPALRVTTPPDHISHAYYKYYVFLKPEMLKTGWNRERIIIAINAEGIPCFTGSCSEMYLEKAFDADCMRPEKRLPVAEELSETAMMFLVHPTLSDNDMLDVVRAVEKVMAVACR